MVTAAPERGIISQLALGIRRKMAPLWLLIVERSPEPNQSAGGASESEYYEESVQDFLSEMLSKAGPAGQIDLGIQVHSCMRAVHDRGSDEPSARERLLALYAYNFIELAKDASQMILPGSASVLLREQEAEASAGRSALPAAALEPVIDAGLKPIHLVNPPLPRATDCEFIKDFGFSVVQSRPRPPPSAPSPQRPNGVAPSPAASPSPSR